ncbi:hypothetical protein J2X87_003483 [Pseudomonas synxantha]|jgi:hypothetical protein|uniref:Uncharacterized protein n=1 Tax=Pseudomonas synxantha TaxID=47883 RepID=A0ACC6JPL2_9PSED|nr:hypothetical protein [Pseudomonas synxantha]
MDVNDNEGYLHDHGALTPIASKLAPTRAIQYSAANNLRRYVLTSG